MTSQTENIEYLPQDTSRTKYREIIPATGMMEAKIEKLLESPNEITPSDFADFADAMNSLKHGIETKKSSGIVSSDNSRFPLQDTENEKKITFGLIKNPQGVITVASITIANQKDLNPRKNREQVSYMAYYENGLKREKVSLKIHSNKRTGFRSYVTGQSEETLVSGNNSTNEGRKLNPEEIREFITKIYGIYNPKYKPPRA